MPRFSEQEKERVYNDIMTKGKELFSIYGLKKTSIDDIVQACGIGKGTFYSFFNSKEELFFAILEKEEGFKDEFIKELMSSSKPPKESFKKFLIDCFNFVENNPFLKRLNDKQELELLFRKLPQETIEKHFNSDTKSSMAFIEKWQQEGIIKQEDPEVLVGILRSLFMFLYFKEEIGAHVYDRVIERHIDFIVDGIFAD